MTGTSENQWPEGFDAAPVILLVDDEPNILSSLNRFLRSTGYLILTAGSGEKALETLQNDPVDLILSDMRMPGIDGAHLLREVRQRWPWTIRILLTGYSEVSAAITAINEGEIYRYLSKPWDDKELLLTVRQAIEKRGLEKEHKRLQILTHQQNEELQNINGSLEQKVQERTQQLAKAHERIKQNFLTSIKVFSSLIEMQTPALAGYSRQVAELGRKIADHMEFSKIDSQNVVVAALLHNIGKLGLPDSLALKPLNQLQSDELASYKKHPIQGANILAAIGDLHDVSLLIRHQHERFDGKGFPDGLSGSAIPKGANILALASDYYALQQGLRVPRKLNADEARDCIIKGKDSLYDPEVVKAFFEVLNKPASANFKEKCIPSSSLTEGMIIERDIFTSDEILIIGAGYIIDNPTITRIRDIEIKEKKSFDIWIRCFN